MTTTANSDMNRERSLANLKPWEPGQSGNPLGRRAAGASLQSMILCQTSDGAELVDWYVRVWKGQVPGLRHPKYRMEAAHWLSDHGFGKPTQELKVEETVNMQLGNPALAEYTVEELRGIRDELRSRRDASHVIEGEGEAIG